MHHLLLYILQHSEYENMCLNEECMEKIISTDDDDSPASTVAEVSKSGHLSSSSVNKLYKLFLDIFRIVFRWAHIRGGKSLINRYGLDIFNLPM